jgi:plastocyanin
MVGMSPYSPTCLTVQVGQTVRIGATTSHPFAKVCAEDTVMDSQDGSTTDVEFTFTTAGYYNYDCGNHSFMVGNIKVLP